MRFIGLKGTHKSLVASINLPELLTVLGNFCEDVFIVNLAYIDIYRFSSGHTVPYLHVWLTMLLVTLSPLL